MVPAPGDALGFEGPVVITGASGFVGGALLRRLAALRSGPPVRALLRAGVRGALPTPVERFAGDLNDERSLAAALCGAGAVVHAAAALESRSAAEIASVNIAGTRRLVDAAVEAGVERLVVLSSAAVYGDRAAGSPRDEETPLAGRGAYAASKIATEREAARFGAAAGAKLTILRPSGLYGPGRRLYADLLVELERHAWRIALPGDRLVQPGHVDDLAGAILAALADPEPGTRIFNVAGPEVLPLEELYTRLARLAGLRLRRLSLPRAVARIAVEMRGWRGGVAPEVLEALRALARGDTIGGALDTRRIERRYGLVWIPLEAGLRKMVAAMTARERA
jgi:nucleoside-diphosphate-sugar epimerase